MNSKKAEYKTIIPIRNFMRQFYLIGKRVLPESLVYGDSSASKLMNLIKRNVLSTIFRGRDIEINGYKMILDPQDSLGLSIFGAYEPYETEVCSKFVKKGSSVLDIGAHIGYYTLLLAKATGTNGKVYAFEPEPMNYKLLEKNILYNEYHNVVLENLAVSDFSGNAKLQLSNSSGGHSLLDIEETNKTVDVRVIKLDDYFEAIDETISVIKIDVQGCEPQVLAGMQNLLAKNRSITIFTEFNPDKKWKSPSDIYLSTLVEKGFRLYHIDERQHKLNETSLEYLFDFYNAQNRTFTNILCTRDY